jgi:hypothetical protein
LRSNSAVGPVRGDDEVVLTRQLFDIAGIELVEEPQRNTELARTSLEYLQQTLARDARKTMAT